MKLYDELIANLVDKEFKTSGINSFLSAYLPLDFIDKKNIKKEIKSLFATVNIGRHFADEINKRVDKIMDTQKGLAFFLELNKESDGIVVIPLLIRPERSVYIGKAFNLNQLMWINSFSPDALILNINQDEARLYKLEGTELCFLSETENEFIEDVEKQRLRKLSMGTDKADKDKIEAVKIFLDKIENIIKSKIRQENNFNYFVVVYSSKYKELVCKFTDKISGIFSNSKVMVLIDKNISENNELKEVAFQKIYEQERLIKRQLLKKAQDEFDNYASGWLKVSQAVNANRIKTLFIKTNTKVKGYILDNKFVYLYPIKGAMMVKNIVPWVIKNLINTSSKIVMFKDRRGDAIPEVAAQLRY